MFYVQVLNKYNRFTTVAERTFISTAENYARKLYRKRKHKMYVRVVSNNYEIINSWGDINY